LFSLVVGGRLRRQGAPFGRGAAGADGNATPTTKLAPGLQTKSVAPSRCRGRPRRL